MKIIRSAAAGFFLSCSGCVPTGYVDPNYGSGVYTAPSGSPDSLATIRGAFVKSNILLLRSAWRARIEAIDGQTVPNSTLVPPTLSILPGHHIVDVTCEYEYHASQVFASVNFQAEAGHHYAAQCDDKSAFINIGTKFWIDDEANGAVSGAAEGWAPSQSPVLSQPW